MEHSFRDLKEAVDEIKWSEVYIFVTGSSQLEARYIAKEEAKLTLEPSYVKGDIYVLFTNSVR